MAATVSQWLKSIHLEDLEEAIKADGVETLEDLLDVEDLNSDLETTMVQLKDQKSLVRKRFMRSFEEQKDQIKKRKIQKEAARDSAGKCDLAKIKEVRTQLKSYETDAESIRQACAKTCNGESDKVSSDLVAQLKALGRKINPEKSLALPPEMTREQAIQLLTRYTDSCKGVADSLRAAEHLDDDKILQEHNVFHAFYLDSEKATQKPTPCIQLKEGCDAGSVIHKGHNHYRETSSVMTSERSSHYKQIADSLGTKTAASLETKGAAFVGAGVAGWSASVSSARATQQDSSNDTSGTSSTTTYFQFSVLLAPMATIRLDPLNDIEFHDNVIAAVAALMADSDSGHHDHSARDHSASTAPFLQFLQNFGTHVPLESELGGSLTNMATTDVHNRATKEDSTAALSTSLRNKAEAGVSCGGLWGGASVAGATSSQRGSNSASGHGQQTALGDSNVRVTTTACGGGLGSIVDPDEAIFLKSLQANGNWGWLGINGEVLKTIWSLLADHHLMPFSKLRQEMPMNLKEAPDEALQNMLSSVCAKLEAVWCQEALGCSTALSEEQAYKMIQDRRKMKEQAIAAEQQARAAAVRQQQAQAQAQAERARQQKLQAEHAAQEEAKRKREIELNRIIEIFAEWGQHFRDVNDVIPQHWLGWTPLHCASQYAWLDVVKSLLDLGADKNAVDKNGKTPWEVAGHCSNGHGCAADVPAIRALLR